MFTEKIQNSINVVKGLRKVNQLSSPTCSQQSLRMGFVTAPTANWKISSIDKISAG